jgi:hypothetical protein
VPEPDEHVARAAHDLNNVLAVITSHTSFAAEAAHAAAERPGGERWVQVAEDLDQVQAAAQEAVRLVASLAHPEQSTGA